ncbi:formylglycine-generating enzyme family protein [Flavobacterium sp. N1994]|uniref:formylglycine-generating enzyme family protein n=1 Tax=Flavobacterium sp. N1994 TaxID=2986827 RepID=UPI0022233D3A|nr:formylglycine-generating enzyme family protein [Flavobacterium sp. N1994]
MKTKNYFSKLAVAILFLVFGFTAKANNLTITGTSVSGSNITFDISWENSWNANVAPANWDAVWVFVKYQDCNTRIWAHAGLSTVSADHTAGSPLQVDTVTDGRGVFIRRSALGGGNIGATSITLKMTIPAGTYNYKVFGIEMVNVPQAAYDLGDGAATSTFNSISVTATSQSSGLSAATIGGAAVAAPATFPMGYNSLYCMKYEISQEQYVDFLNSLTYDQQAAHVVNDPVSVAGTYAMFAAYYYRNGIRILTPGNNNAIPAVFACDATAGVENNTNDGQNIAMNNLSWNDLTAYLDWAALRPMTEMEYEKISRGPVGRIANEYVWGSTTINAVNNGVTSNNLQPNESYASVLNGLCAYGLNSSNVGYGPLRCGIFATGSSGRASSGAGYYGVMEMAGNVWERVVSLGNASGSAFNGTLGDGTITALGLANQATWPSPTTALGTGYKGGSWNDYGPSGYEQTSNRAVSTTADAARQYSFGGRGVR